MAKSVRTATTARTVRSRRRAAGNGSNRSVRAGRRPRITAAGQLPGGGTLLLVNMIPRSLSDETNQDSEPTLAVNPRNNNQIVGTAFTPDPLGGNMAPVFISSDGGTTWSLNSIVPSETETADICVGFGRSGHLYAGILKLPAPFEDTRLNIVRTSDAQSTAPMRVLVDRLGVDQPYVQTTPSVNAASRDRVYVGDNDFRTDAQTSTIDFSLNARVANARFKKAQIDARPNTMQNGPQVRPACHSSGRVYLAFMRWTAQHGSWTANTLVVTADLVVVRDDNGGSGPSPFTSLVDPSDLKPGVRVARSITFPFHHDENGVPGQQRLGGDVAIAVDPTNRDVVYVAFASLEQSGYTVHVRRSTDAGLTWSGDLRRLPGATNPSLAVNSQRKVGLLYQQLTGTSALRWVTHFDRSSDGGTGWTSFVLADTPANQPVADFSPYLGDYDCVLSVGKDFYGIFSANNAPDNSHFPNGVVYQRNADFATRRLLGLDNSTTVRVSIDPFFFKVTE
jgi:hypothetical protein